MNRRFLRLISAVAIAVLFIGACGDSDDEDGAAESDDTTTTTETAKPNTCPAEGCRVRFTNATRASDGELVLTFDANYTPDDAGNHFHVFWDTFKPEQVSDDAERKHNVKQGDWEPTAANPYTTANAASVKTRGQSTKICVTAGDRDHNVLDPKLFDCRDVSSLLS